MPSDGPIWIVRQTEEYERWFAALRDRAARARIDVRIRRLSLGNFGDARFVANGVWELRVNCGPGYRIYYVRDGDALILLLCGGDKSSQQRDIRRAIEIAEQL